jgi:transcriptional regulator with XRE-family HTH domain
MSWRHRRRQEVGWYRLAVEGCKLRDCGTIAMRNAALAPHVKALMAQRELAADHSRPEGVDDVVVGVPTLKHAALYQRLVDIATALSLLAQKDGSDQKACMQFGEKLESAIRASEFKNPNRLAVALGWSPQRLSNYIKKDRIPDRPSLRAIAEKLKTTPEALISEGDENALRDILLRLFELEGIPEDRADTLASAFLVAKRLLSTFPDEGELQTRARLAAHSAWQTQPPPALGTQ